MLAPFGPLCVLVGPRGLERIVLPRKPPCAVDAQRDDADVRVTRVKDQLREYFAGTRRGFDLPLDPSGTAFDLSVWRYVLGIPFGEVRTYANLAQACSVPNAFRAVGAANGRNPLPIIVPCHRVVGAGGRLTGYGGGLELKARLLRLEGHPLDDEVVTKGTRVAMG
ncbi:MAG: methylated-DNA--[protein]-cysteine S-methyltransferase [Planctomycetes bacterium]|nr:methylated-DNA--[protein]-cysteine S-methyltransferase [Planctomycetota bacterium]MCC7170359.1 methylated-DNA--[protein]-cysteine S-methyltransferase [Planctomycetota bacterium]